MEMVSDAVASRGLKNSRLESGVRSFGRAGERQSSRMKCGASAASVFCEYRGEDNDNGKTANRRLLLMEVRSPVSAVLFRRDESGDVQGKFRERSDPTAARDCDPLRSSS